MFDDYRLLEKKYKLDTNTLLYIHTIKDSDDLKNEYGVIITNKKGIFTLTLNEISYNLEDETNKKQLLSFLSTELYEFEVNGLKPSRNTPMNLTYYDNTLNKTITKYHGHDDWETIEQLLYISMKPNNYLIKMEIPLNRNKTTNEYLEKEYEKYLRRNSIQHEEKVIEFTRQDYDEWKKEVRRRYDDTCIVCGKTFKMHTHHILPKSLYPERVADLHNGVAICKYCHEEYHDRTKLADVNVKTFLEFVKFKVGERYG